MADAISSAERSVWQKALRTTLVTYGRSLRLAKARFSTMACSDVLRPTAMEYVDQPQIIPIMNDVLTLSSCLHLFANVMSWGRIFFFLPFWRRSSAWVIVSQLRLQHTYGELFSVCYKRLHLCVLHKHVLRHSYRPRRWSTAASSRKSMLQLSVRV